MAAEGAEPSPKHLESVDEKLTDLKKQICDLRDFLEMKLSHQPEILEILHLDSGDTGAPTPPLKPEKGLMFSASNIEGIESSPKQEDAQDENLDEYGERKKPIAKVRSSLASFVEDSMFHFKARAQMQSDRIRATRRTSAPAVNSQSCQSRVKDFVFSPLCSVLITILILVNVILLGVEVDVAAALPDGEEVPAWFGVTNGVIVVFFVLEMGLKVYGLGYRDFWCGQDCVWNALDFFIVSVSVMDVSLDMLAQMLSSSMNTGHLRLVRAIRLARAVRGVKVVRVFRYITALRTLALSIISTMGSLFWTLALLMLIFYFFAIVLTQLVSDNCRFLKIDGAAGTGHVCQDSLPRFWGSVSESMLTLFMAITNGISWDDTIRPLRQVSYVGIMFVIAYIAIAVLAVLNVVTGVFCNTAIESAHADKEVATIKQVHSKDQQVDALRSIFNEIDIDSSQEVSFQDVQEAMNTGELASFMEAMGISTDDVWTLCMLLDSDKNGRIDLDDFVSGCMQLHGPAKSLQLAKMSFENKLTRRAIQQVKEEIEGLKMSLRSERRPMLTAKETF